MKQAVLALLLLFSITNCGGTPEQKSAVSAVAPSSSTPLNSSTVVFLGDSITGLWNLSAHFPGQPFVNRGVGGNTTAMMMARFNTDVVGANPGIVVILGGTNDIAQVGGTDDATLEANLTALYGLAAANNVRVVACTITPMRATMAFHNAQIVRVNSWIRSYAASKNIQLADYYAAVVGADGELRSDYTEILYDGVTLDTVHLNESAYLVLDPIVNAAIKATH